MLDTNTRCHASESTLPARREHPEVPAACLLFGLCSSFAPPPDLSIPLFHIVQGNLFIRIISNLNQNPIVVSIPIGARSPPVTVMQNPHSDVKIDGASIESEILEVGHFVRAGLES